MKAAHNSPTRHGETSELCNNFLLAPKVNGKVRLYLDLDMLNNVLNRPAHRIPLLNDTLPWLAGVKYLTCINASLGYHNLKLDEMASHLTTFLVCLAGGNI